MTNTMNRSVFRIGVVALACAVMQLALTLPVRAEDGALWWLAWLIVGAITALGVGLVAGVKVARIVAGVGFLGGAVIAPILLGSALLDGARPDHWDPLTVLSLANAVMTTVLGVWLSVRAVQITLGSGGWTGVITARLVGVTLAAIAANHLWLAVVLGIGLGVSELGALSVSVSMRGTQVLGFAGWPIWHLVLLGIGLTMAWGPRRIVERAAGLLVLWLACLVPWAARELTGLLPGLGVFLVVLVAIPVYLAWWLRSELRAAG